jgi:hypothetical protein
MVATWTNLDYYYGAGGPAAVATRRDPLYY